MEGEEEIVNPSDSKCQHLIAAFLSMEPTNCLISLAQECGGGSITMGVQSFIWDHCVNNVAGRSNVPSHLYIKKFLKKVIVTVESSGHDVLDGLYEQYAYYMTSFKDDSLLKGNTRVYKSISFFFPNGCPGDQCSRPMKLVVPLQCSINMFEGDTGCSIWPSSLFLSEFILSYPEIFSNKSCFEVGSGVGLVGVSLTHANASKSFGIRFLGEFLFIGFSAENLQRFSKNLNLVAEVVLSDGDLSTLANMKFNLELNQLNAETMMSHEAFHNHSLIECKYLLWESASGELHDIKPDIVLGADIIYDPSCVPHLVRVLTILLTPNEFRPHQVNERCHDVLIENYINDRINDSYDEKFSFNQNRIREHFSICGDDNQNAYISFPQKKDATFHCEDSEGNCCRSNPQNGHGLGTLQDKTSENVTSNGESQIKQGSVAYLATVIRNSDTFNYFLRLADQAHLSVVNITETSKPLNLLPYMRSYDRSSIQLYTVSFSCN